MIKRMPALLFALTLFLSMAGCTAWSGDTQNATKPIDFLLISLSTVIILLVLMTILFIKYRRLTKNLETIIETRTAELERQTITLTTIYSSIPDLIFCKDLNGRYTGCNPSFEKFAGCTEAELIGKTDAEIFKIDGKMARLFVEADKRVFAGSALETTEELITYPDGTTRLTETVKTPIAQNGVVIGMVGIGRDITERKNAELLLEQRLEQQNLMTALSQIFISKEDADTCVTEALQMLGEFMGLEQILLVKYERHALHYRYEWRSSADAASYLGTVQPLTEANIKITSAFERREMAYFSPESADGTTGSLLLPMFVGKSFWGFLEFCQGERAIRWSASDINLGKLFVATLSGALDRQEMENNLLRMSALVNSSPQYIAYVNAEGKFDFFNPASHDITGFSHDELMAGGLQILYSDETNRRIRDEILPQIFALGTYDFELPLVRKDGAERIMAFSAFTIMTDAYACGTIATDVTEQKRLEAQLIEAKEIAEGNSRSKSEFLSRMSHEMRTPMNAIIGMTGIGRAAEEIERKNYCLDKIDAASTHLLGVINDVLDMSKIEAGKFELSYTDFSLETMFTKITSVLAFRMEEKSLVFTVKVDGNVPPVIRSDEQRLTQVVTNLLGNAIKFTPQGGSIALFVRKLSASDGTATLQFEVRDTGIGITDEQQRRLFTSFEQADGGISRKYGGTGLGLAISKSIVELMGGTIWVESVVGEGSRFLFNICAEVGTASAQPSGCIDGENAHGLAADDRAAPDSPVRFQGRRILLAEDVEVNREIVLALLEPTELQIDCAENGQIAFEMFRSYPDYEVILMDVHMPEVSGYEATQMIRTLPDPRAHAVPIIAMTANVFREDIEKCIEAGMDDHIGKPLDLGDMMTKLCKHMRPDAGVHKTDTK